MTDRGRELKEVSILHCADFHLGAVNANFGERSEERARDKVRAFREMIRYCNENAIQLLLIAGDFFEGSDATRELIGLAAGEFASLRVTRVFIAPGNHDYYSIDSPYAAVDWPANTKIFMGEAETVEIPEWSVSVTGAGFTGTYRETPFFEELAPRHDGMIHIGLVHGQVVSEGATSAYHPVRPDRYADGLFDYLALGHVHKPSGVLAAGRLRYAYPGCAVGAGFDEAGPRGVLVGTVGDLGCRLEMHELCGRRVERVSVDMTGCGDLEECRKRVRAAVEPLGTNHYFRLYFEGALAEELRYGLRLLEDELRGELFYLSVRDRTRPAADLSSLAGEETLRGLFTRRALARIDQARASGDAAAEASARRALRVGLLAFEGEVRIDELA